MVLITAWVTIRKLDFGNGLASRYESLIKSFMITFLYSGTVRLSNFDTVTHTLFDERNTYNPKGTANPTLVLGSVIINSILMGDRMVNYNVSPPELLEISVYKFNNLGKYAGMYILGPLVASLLGGILASFF